MKRMKQNTVLATSMALKPILQKNTSSLMKKLFRYTFLPYPLHLSHLCNPPMFLPIVSLTASPPCFLCLFGSCFPPLIPGSPHLSAKAGDLWNISLSISLLPCFTLISEDTCAQCWGHSDECNLTLLLSQTSEESQALKSLQCERSTFNIHS